MSSSKGPGFRTAAERRAEQLAEAEQRLEAVKRGVETALETYSENSRERMETLRFCARIGLELSFDRPGAGLEFETRDIETVVAAMDATPLPASLKRFVG